MVLYTHARARSHTHTHTHTHTYALLKFLEAGNGYKILVEETQEPKLLGETQTS